MIYLDMIKKLLKLLSSLIKQPTKIDDGKEKGKGGGSW